MDISLSAAENFPVKQPIISAVLVMACVCKLGWAQQPASFTAELAM